MRINPILEREVRERMRSMRAPALITIYLLLLGTIVVLAERFMTENAGFNGASAFASAALGRAIFHWLLFFTLLLVCFLVPAFTAGAIATERAGRTLQLLQVTLLKPRAIVLGKLASSMGFVFLLIVATAPLMSVSFILGGVTPVDVLRGYGMILLTALTFGMLGIGLSANLRRPMAATVLTYALMASLTLGTVLTYGAIRLARRDFGQFGGGREPVYSLVLNPFVGTASALSGSGARSGSASPFDPVIDMLNRRDQVRFGRALVARPEPVFGGVDGTVPAPPDAPMLDPDGVVQVFDPVAEEFRRIQPEQPGSRLPVWASTVGWYLLLILLGYRLAVIGVRTPMSGIGFGRRRIALGDG